MTPTASVPANYLHSAGFRRLSVREYHDIIKAGIITDGEPIELLEGYMVRKMARGTSHDSVMDTLDGLWPRVVTSEWFVRSQRAITLADSEPEPDYAIVRGPRSRYRTSHPTPADIGLVVEISASSLLIDTSDKARIYAAAGVPVYWVVNIPDRKVVVFGDPDPTGGGFRTRDEFQTGNAVPVVLDGTAVGSILVADILP